MDYLYEYAEVFAWLMLIDAALLFTAAYCHFKSFRQWVHNKLRTITTTTRNYLTGRIRSKKGKR